MRSLDGQEVLWGASIQREGGITKRFGSERAFDGRDNEAEGALS
jgi:hypothetical protein